MNTSFRFLKLAARIVLCGVGLGVAACGNPGDFAGTYQGVLRSDVEPQLQAETTVVIGPSSGTPDMNVRFTLDGGACDFDANRSSGGASAAMIPRGGCMLTTARGPLIWDWTGGMIVISGTQLGLNLNGDLSAAYAPTGHGAGDSLLLSFDGRRQAP